MLWGLPGDLIVMCREGVDGPVGCAVYEVLQDHDINILSQLGVRATLIGHDQAPGAK